MFKERCIFVMPTYNTYEKESKHSKQKKPSRYRNVGCVLESLICVIEKNFVGRQHVVIVNDSCTDKTEIKLRKLLTGKTKRVSERVNESQFKIEKNDLDLTITLLKHTDSDRIGLNFAVVDGYRRALKENSEFVVKLDSDGEHDETQSPKLLEKIVQDTNLVFVRFEGSDQKDGGAFGFRIIRRAALVKLIDRLEEYARNVWKLHPNHREKQTEIDQETWKLIKQEYPCQWCTIPF